MSPLYEQRLTLHACESTLDFLMASMRAELQVDEQQAIALLTTKGGLLDTILTQGIKGSFSLVIRWLNQIQRHSKQLATLLILEDGTALVDSNVGHSAWVVPPCPQNTSGG